jgi:putative flippase GtrA
VKRARADLAGTLGRFAVVGGATSVLYLVVGHVLSAFAGLSVLTATSLAFILVVAVNYVFHYQWTFEATVRHRVAMARFIVASAGGFALNMLLVGLLVGTHAVPLPISQTVVIVVVTGWNFLLNFLWVFTSRSAVDRSQASD